MKTKPREFKDFDAATINAAKPLLVGITSPSGGGKTFSALTLATGMQKVVGGEIFVIDTESDRALHYRDMFRFRHVPFPPPHGAQHYEQAIDYCVGRGAKIIIVDSMSHEHMGEGGHLDQSEAFLDQKAGDDWNKRERFLSTSWIIPAGHRKRLNRKIIDIGAKAIFIFCYRAEDKTKPPPKGSAEKGMIHVGWTATTTSQLPYEMTVRFLLPPGSDGHPNLKPDTEFEKLSIKLPCQFRDWFKPGFQLTEEVGEKLAKWSVGEGTAPAKSIVESWKLTVESFGNLGVSEGQILARLNCRGGEDINDDHIGEMRRIYAQIKRGEAKAEKFFLPDDDDTLHREAFDAANPAPEEDPWAELDKEELEQGFGG